MKNIIIAIDGFSSSGKIYYVVNDETTGSIDL